MRVKFDPSGGKITVKEVVIVKLPSTHCKTSHGRRWVMTLNERIEANADITLWCVHVLGSDDVMAAPNHAAAVVRARELNKMVFGRVSTPNDVLCFAYAAPWPHSPEAHADDLQKQRLLLSSAPGGPTRPPTR